MENVLKVTVEFVGPGMYKSTDHVTGATIAVKAGDVVVLSAQKAGQVLRDFPKEWRRVAGAADPAPAPATSPAVVVPPPAAPPPPPLETTAPAPKAAPKKKAPGRR